VSSSVLTLCPPIKRLDDFAVLPPPAASITVRTVDVGCFQFAYKDSPQHSAAGEHDRGTVARERTRECTDRLLICVASGEADAGPRWAEVVDPETAQASGRYRGLPGNSASPHTANWWLHGTPAWRACAVAAAEPEPLVGAACGGKEGGQEPG
jgi:hypothetical protein